MYKRAPFAIRLRKPAAATVTVTSAASDAPSFLLDDIKLSKKIDVAISKFNFQAVVEDTVVRNIEDYIVANKSRLASFFAQEKPAESIVDINFESKLTNKIIDKLDLAVVADSLSDKQLKKIAQNIDYDALTEQMNMDQLAACLDSEELASHISIGSTDLDYEKLASEIDVDSLAEALEESDTIVEKIVAKRSFVKSVVKNLSDEIEKAVKRVLKAESEPEEKGAEVRVIDSALNAAKNNFAKLGKLTKLFG